jgi:hypothetical protein
MKGRVSDAEIHLMVEEGRGELNLQYMRLDMMSIRHGEGKGLEEQAYSVGNSTENIKIVVKLVTSQGL